MNFREAVRAILEGKEVRRAAFPLTILSLKLPPPGISKEWVAALSFYDDLAHVGDFEEVIKDRTVRMGDRVQSPGGEQYIVASAGSLSLVLVNIQYGSRYDNPVLLDKPVWEKCPLRKLIKYNSDSWKVL